MKKTVLISILTVSLIIPIFSNAEEIAESQTMATQETQWEATESIEDTIETEAATLVETETETTSQSSMESAHVSEAVLTSLESDLSNTQLVAFITGLYQKLLLRDPDPQGLSYWYGLLSDQQATGADIVYGFLHSDEFKGKNLSRDNYVTLLYQAILGREPDEQGLYDWVYVFEEGFSRDYVCYNLIASGEFENLCHSYGITPGTITLTDMIDTHDRLTRFINRFYVILLGRTADDPGRRHWVSMLVNNEKTAAEVARDFVLSEEFTKNNFDDKAYVESLYEALFNRYPDSVGKSSWINDLNQGMSRSYVLKGLVDSQEFADICNEYKVTKGTIALTEARDMNKKTTAYVSLTFAKAMGRKLSDSDLNMWTSKLNSGQLNAKTYLYTLIFSDEFNSKKLSNEDFIKCLYEAFFNRGVDSGAMTQYTAKLKAGTPRTQVFAELAISAEFKQFIGTYGLKVERVYQNPSQYYQIQESISLSGGDYNLSRGYMGLKVAKVQRKLGLGIRRAIMDNITINAVASFQRKNGLTANGVVDLKTWKAMGLNENEWYTLGQYVSPMRINENSTRSDCIEAMIATAMTYLGTEYIIGASGAPGTGVDCSGFVMQALYSAGLDLSPINPIRHASPGYEYESRSMWSSSKFKHVSYSQRQRGDLIFYANSKGVVIHVAIYLGNNMVIESTPNQVVIWPIKNSVRANIIGVARPFV